MCRPDVPVSNEVQYMLNRVDTVQQHFPTATSMDDFMFRVETALCAYGFTGENSIGGCTWDVLPCCLLDSS